MKFTLKVLVAHKEVIDWLTTIMSELPYIKDFYSPRRRMVKISYKNEPITTTLTPIKLLKVNLSYFICNKISISSSFLFLEIQDFVLILLMQAFLFLMPICDIFRQQPISMNLGVDLRFFATISNTVV